MPSYRKCYIAGATADIGDCCRDCEHLKLLGDFLVGSEDVEEFFVCKMHFNPTYFYCKPNVSCREDTNL